MLTSSALPISPNDKKSDILKMYKIEFLTPEEAEKFNKQKREQFWWTSYFANFVQYFLFVWMVSIVMSLTCSTFS